MNARPAKNVDPAAVVGHFINGQDVADDNRPLPVTNPATGQVIRHVAMASGETVTAAIAAAQGIADFEFDYVGAVPLAKDYGEFVLYHVHGVGGV